VQRGVGMVEDCRRAHIVLGVIFTWRVAHLVPN